MKNETVSIWLEIHFRMNSDFHNHHHDPSELKTRITKITQTAFHRLRVWKEYFYRFSDSPYNLKYVLDADE